jgi:hypothetical protein
VALPQSRVVPEGQVASVRRGAEEEAGRGEDGEAEGREAETV